MWAEIFLTDCAESHQEDSLKAVKHQLTKDVIRSGDDAFSEQDSLEVNTLQSIVMEGEWEPNEYEK